MMGKMVGYIDLILIVQWMVREPNNDRKRTNEKKNDKTRKTECNVMDKLKNQIPQRNDEAYKKNEIITL